jgi:hypothetical protein
MKTFIFLDINEEQHFCFHLVAQEFYIPTSPLCLPCQIWSMNVGPLIQIFQCQIVIMAK